MKKGILLFIMCLPFATSVIGQAKMSKEEKLKEHIIALDTDAWDAWKNRKVEWFEMNTAESFLSINSYGISNKAQVLEATPTECDVKSYSLSDFDFNILNKKTVHLTYIAMQEGTCGDTKLAPKVRASVIYTKIGGRWLETVYVETAVD